MKKLLKLKPKGIVRIDTVAPKVPLYPDSGDIVISFMHEFMATEFELHIAFNGYFKWYQIIDEEGE